MTRKEIQERQAQLNAERAELLKKEREESEKRYQASRASREKAEERRKQLEPFVIAYVKREIKEGDIIRCKAYRGEKKVVELKEYTHNYSSVVAICGSINRKTGKFETNGSGSETYSGNVTEVLRNGKFQKIKDLIKDYKF